MGKNWKQRQILFSWSLKSLWMMTAAMKLKKRKETRKHLLLRKKAVINLDNILKSRNIILPTKVQRVKAMVFPVIMFACESWTGLMKGTGSLGLVHWDDPEGWYGEGGGRGFQDGEHVYTSGRCMLMYGKTNTILWSKIIVIIKIKNERRLRTEELMISNCSAGEGSWESLGQQEDQTSQSWRKSTLNILWKDCCWGWGSSALTTSCEEPTRWKRSWCWERLRAGGEGGNRGCNGWMASSTQWTWVWTNSAKQWRTGRPGMLQSLWSKRARHDWAIEQQQQLSQLKNFTPFLSYTLGVLLTNIP